MSARRRILLASLIAVAIVAALRPQAVTAAFERLFRFIELGGDPLPASPPLISDHEIEQLREQPPQVQAERLLERAINGYRGATELIAADVDAWRGELRLEGALQARYMVALNANDLRVRAAALEIYLAAQDVGKAPDEVHRIMRRAEENPAARPWALWVLGLLANRDVERYPILEFLVAHLRDPEEEVRHWAVEGLAYSGSPEVVPYLLEVFHDDPSPVVRERAACGLAQSGMLTPEVRRTALPALLAYTEDPALDAQTRRWTFQALRDITGQQLPDDPEAWRDWWRG